MINNVRDIAKGEPLLGTRLSEPYPIVRSVKTITGQGCNVFQTEEGGTTIQVPTKTGGRLVIIGKIVNAGPDGQADYSDARYWVQIEYLNTSGVYDAIKLQDEKTIYTNPKGQIEHPVVVMATNLNEQSTKTHNLATDGSVYVVCTGFYDKGDIQTLHWLFSPSAGASLVIITGTATRPGVYSGQIFVGGTNSLDQTTSSLLSNLDIGTGGASIYIVNLSEIGKNTHDLAADGGGFVPSIFLAVPIGTTSDKTPLYAINGFQLEDCT